MVRQLVISREYKFALKAKHFMGDEASLLQSADEFWLEMKKAIKNIAAVSGSDIAIKSRREIKFYDTQDLILQNLKYIFRQRSDLESRKKEITLKFRHPDRYVSQARDMSTQNSAESEIKFEEDIKPPFFVLYSFSATIPVDDVAAIRKLKHLVNIYPGLGEQLTPHLEEKISVVNDLVINEIVISGPQIILNKDASQKAECALIIWYDAAKSEEKPLIAEFSFRYKNKEEAYNAEISQKAYDVFMLLQQKLKGWIDKNNATKTGLVFANR